MSISFTLGATVVTLPSPSARYPARAARRQAVGRSVGGTVYVYDKGAGAFEVELPLGSLNDAEKAALGGFFDGTAQGARNAFTYADSEGVTHTARFAEPKLEFHKVSAGVWDVRLRLELSDMGG
jgi:hypothetical protein